MLKTRIKQLLVSALLASLLGLTSTYAPPDEQSADGTRLAPLTATAMEQATLPAAPDSVSKQLPEESSRGKAAKAPQTAVHDAKPAPAGSSQQTSRETDSKRAAVFADLNSYVITALTSYRGQSYPYLLNEDYANYNGVTANIYYQNQLLLKAHPSGNRASHCVGITFETFFRAMQARNKAIGIAADSMNGMSFTDLQDFVQIWYAAKGSADSNPAAAICKYGLGRRITDWEQAKAGDFVDFSRSNQTGHSVVFLNWIRRDGAIVGLRYWSSQGSTNGVGYKKEYFQGRDLRGAILTEHFSIGRVGPTASYR